MRMVKTAAAVVLAMAGAAMGQDTLPAPSGVRQAYVADSGPLTNQAAGVERVWTHRVRINGAPWLRVHFAGWNLPRGSYVVVRSVLDGEEQVMDEATVEMWGGGTAYFNGDELEVELFAAPGAQGARVILGELEVGTFAAEGDPSECGICGSDDRTPSEEIWTARLMPVGCTASILCEDSTMLTAGHCVGANQVVQFLVPPSNANCSMVHPPVDEQFPVTAQNSQNSGVGGDWGVLAIGTNGLGERPFTRYGELRRPTTRVASVGEVASMWGYGLDTTCTRSQTQQFASGNITAVRGTSYEFNTDVRGGNSGSALIVNGEVVAVVTHCSWGCPNFGTRIDQPALANALRNRMLCDTAVDLVVHSDPQGAVIDVEPADIGGRLDGTAGFTRVYQPGTSVTLTAEEEFGELTFQGWTVNGVGAGDDAAVTFVISEDAVAVALYELECGADISGSSDPNNEGYGFPDGVVDAADFFYFLDQFVFVNHSVADLSGSSDPNDPLYGVPDGLLDASDFFYFLDLFATGCD